MRLLSKIIYFFFNKFNKIFTSEEFYLYTIKHNIYNLSIDYNTIVRNDNYDNTVFVERMYLKKINNKWSIILDTKTEHLGKNYIYASHDSLENALNIFGRILNYESFFIGDFTVNRFEEKFIKPLIAKKEAEFINISKSDIETLFTPFKDIDSKAMCISGFILRPGRTYGGYLGLGNGSPICSDIIATDEIGFIIYLPNKNEETTEEVNHLIENISILYPEYRCYINNRGVSFSEIMSITVSKKYDDQFNLIMN